ncbi:MBL fold metallo-hydrolase [Streptomyces sp. SID5785]|uniref:MBL fold metallo-hydrolase n=1 Tax=Streptomyces sp. SID5785 TaxID=2690309 RepID=UPI0013612543|nr:MBL fold metallo-hydrolase [Streptomyces sp. SID5785]MZD09873.1 MBL fold metallo-hydrolase [Streptomyces sp. SID5785]
MTTTVTLTGTGVPFPSPDRAGPGVLVSHEDVHLQLDAGRSTLMRLMQAGLGPHQLSALFLTHVHSDHVSDVADLVHTRWIQDHLYGTGPLPVVAVDGHASAFVRGVPAANAYDVDVRVQHVQDGPPEVVGHWFDLPAAPTEVWRSPCGRVVVEAVRVRHEPVEQAVGYRITTPDGVVVVSGDTRVCEEIEDLATGADVLVHEACRGASLAEHVKGTRFETIFSYHADTTALGAMARRTGVPHLVLTHLIPAPDTPGQADEFEDEVRRGGFEGRVSVGHDLLTVTLGDGGGVKGDVR